MKVISGEKTHPSFSLHISISKFSTFLGWSGGTENVKKLINCKIKWVVYLKLNPFTDLSLVV